MTGSARRYIAIGLSTLLPLSAAAQGLDLNRGKGTPIEIVARDGIEWNRDAQQYIARGNARATQGDTTVEAEVLTAYYREGASSRTEIYRYQADRDVRIFTPTHRAVGDRAIYDIDSGVLVLTGNKLKLTTPAEVITARDALEYWEQRQVAVARGDALAVTEDGRRMKADLLTAHFTDQKAGSGATQTTGSANRSASSSAGKSDGETRRVQRIEAFGHVHISTEAEIAVGDRGVYNTETGIAVLAGNVKITRGQNQLNGDYAEVNTNTGISRLLSRPDPGGDNRVRGLFVPENENSPGRRQTAAVAEPKSLSVMSSPRKPESNGADAALKAGPRLVADNPGLRANKLGKRFKKRPVVRDVSVSVQRGEVVGLLGPNGAGKTTCFYMITGLIAPDSGEIKLDGADITDLPMYRRARLGIGYLPQEPSIFRGLSVEQNIRAVLEVVESDPDRREGLLDDLLAEFSITHLRRTPALALSGGERRRVEIARALASQPHFILLDEPLAGIDPIAVGDIRDLVLHLKDRGIGVLITDHNVRETLEIVDRAYILHDGQVLMEGLPAEIVSHEGVRRVYLGERFSL